MNEQDHILDIYGAIADKTGEMLDAAQRSDWDRLTALEKDCRALIECLRHTDAGPATGAKFVQRKIAHIRKVLADDAEIRKFTEPWMAELEIYIGSARRQRELRSAYDSGPGG